MDSKRKKRLTDFLATCGRSAANHSIASPSSLDAGKVLVLQTFLLPLRPYIGCGDTLLVEKALQSRLEGAPELADRFDRIQQSMVEGAFFASLASILRTTDGRRNT